MQLYHSPCIHSCIYIEVCVYVYPNEVLAVGKRIQSLVIKDSPLILYITDKRQNKVGIYFSFLTLFYHA